MVSATQQWSTTYMTTTPPRSPLTARNLSKSYGAVRALADVNLEIPPGQTVAIMGRNGMGKSTLLKSVIGVLKSRWTRRGWLISGTEILLLGAFAGIAGFFFGNLLPGLLGGAPAV